MFRQLGEPVRVNTNALKSRVVLGKILKLGLHPIAANSKGLFKLPRNYSSSIADSLARPDKDSIAFLREP